jgi:thiol-disulfide isomerase/thioredoxin
MWMRIFTLMILLLTSFISKSQDTDPPYLKNPTLPNFSILQEDSSSWFTNRDIKKGVPVIIMLFSPDCDHCREQTVILTKNMGKLKNTEIVMSSFQPVSKIREFCREFDLHKYPNVHIGRDVKYFFGPFYRIKFAPLLAVYNKEGNLVKVFEGDTKIDKLVEATLHSTH